GSKTVRVGLTLDLVWRPSWTDTEIDALVVPHPVFRELALRRKVPEGAIRTAGVPLPRPFSRTLDPKAIRQKFGLDPANGVPIIVLAEGIEEPRLDRLVFQLSLVERKVQPIFYVGEDAAAARALRRAAGEYG